MNETLDPYIYKETAYDIKKSARGLCTKFIVVYSSLWYGLYYKNRYSKYISL